MWLTRDSSLNVHHRLRIAEEIPPGLAFVCLDSKGLPLALNRILTSKIIT
jgi:hypothetical protein